MHWMAQELETSAAPKHIINMSVFEQDVQNTARSSIQADYVATHRAIAGPLASSSFLLHLGGAARRLLGLQLEL